MSDLDQLPDAAEELAAIIRASVLPADAVLAVELVPDAPARLPTGITTYLRLDEVSGGGQLDQFRADVQLQLDVWAPDRATARAAFEALRRHLCRRGGHAVTVGSIPAVTCTSGLIPATSDVAGMAHYVALFTATTSSRGG